MAQLPALPAALNAGDPENINDVVTNLEALRNAVNGISSDQINNGAVGLTELTANIVNSLVPVGTIIDWFPPSSASPPWDAFVPSGYVVCDGRAWSTVTNDLGFSTGNVPNLIGLTTYGATAATARNQAAVFQTGTGVYTNAGVGGAVGTSSHNTSHQHAVGQHQHGMQHWHGVANHTHGLTGKQFTTGVGNTSAGLAFQGQTNEAASYTGQALQTGNYYDRNLTDSNADYLTGTPTGDLYRDNRTSGLAFLKIMKVRSAA